MKNKLILLLLLCFWGVSTVSAQVATASLDSTKKSRSASANSWRFGSTFSIQMVEGRHAPANVWNKKAQLENNIHFAWQPSNMTLEVANVKYTDRVWAPATDVLTDSTRNHTGVNLSVRGNDEMSIGVSYETDSIAEAGFVERKKSNYGGSFGARLGGLFLASGMRVHKEEVVGYAVKNWKSTEVGIAYMLGSPELYQFRVEYAMFNEEGRQVVADYLGTKAPNTETILSVEFLYKGFYMGYHKSDRVRGKILAEPNNRLNQDAEYGFGWRDMDYTFMLYKINGLETEGVKELRSLRYRLTFGFNFI